MIEINTAVNTNSVTFSSSKNIPGTKHSSIYINYEENISRTPKHIFNYMLGILLSEILSWSNEKIVFDSLTKDEAISINNHIRLNHVVNPYGKCKNKKISVVNSSTVVRRPTIKKSGKVLAANGIGKDGILLANILNELKVDFINFTVGNQFKKDSIWQNRIKTVKEFSNSKNIKHTLIATDFFKLPYKIIPWHIFALPLAYCYGADTILTGLSLGDTKVSTKNKLPIRPNISIFSLKDISYYTGYNITSPFFSITDYGSQKVLFDRYLETVKYQKSCMYDSDYCNRCAKCYGVYLILKDLRQRAKKSFGTELKME